MPVDPMIARGGVPLDVTDTLARARMLQQRDRMIAQDETKNALWERQQQAALDRQNALAAEEDEQDRAFEAARAAGDWDAMAAIDPVAAKTLWDFQQARQPKAPIAPPEVRSEGGYSYMFDPAKGVVPGSVQAPQRAPQSAPPQPQLKDIALPDGTVQSQWIRPGEATGTPVGAPKTPKADREAQKTEIALASTFANQSKDFNTVSGQYRRVLAVSKNPSPANDFALIYAFAKIQDPTSVVRESEFAQAAKTGAYGDQVAAAIGRVANGKTLTERQRYDFVNAARNAYEAQRQQWESSVVAPAKRQAEAYGLNWDNIYKDYTVKEESAPPKVAPKSFKHKSGATVTYIEE